MSCHKYNRLTEHEQHIANVLKYQSQQLHEIDNRLDDSQKSIDSSILESEAILKKYGKKVNQANFTKPQRHNSSSSELRSWDKIVAEAETKIDSPALITDLLAPDEIQLVEQKIYLLRGEFNEVYKLDKIDWAICGIAGILAALVDIFLIQMPAHPGFLGGKVSDGGPLANWIKEKINNTLSPEEIRQLEKENWVPYDPSTSKGLFSKIEGLGPTTHRYQSLGHDPILGFIFGVKDILHQTFTAIDKNGNLIIQGVDIKDSSIIGMNLFEALGRVLGHLQSDIATPSGLPVPLMPLFQFLQFGNIGKSGYTIGEISRIMYRSGYDFRHFLAMSISPLLIEVIVRLGYFAKRMSENNSFLDSIPFDLPMSERKPKLKTMLFSAHLVATAANAGKVTITQNPLMINYSQWIAFFRYLIPQLKWVLVDKENKRFQYLQSRINQDWQDIDRALEETWNIVNTSPIELGSVVNL